MPGFAPPPRHQDQKIQHAQAGIWWPAADSAKLRSAAQAWREMAAALDEVHAATRSAAWSVQADSQGPAIDAFEIYWQKWSASDGFLPAASEGCIAMAKALEKYAQAVDDARAKIEQLVFELGTAVVIGVALSVLTVGISDVAAGAVSAGLIASAAAVGVDLSATAVSIATMIIVDTAFGAVEAMAIDVVAIQPEKILIFHDQKAFSWEEVLQWGEMGAAGAFFGAAATGGIRVIAIVGRTVVDELPAGEDGAVLILRYKAEWTEAQRASADAKITALNHVDDLVVTTPQRVGRAQRLFRTQNHLDDQTDADHIVDLQLGGKDSMENIWGLDSSVNRSLGKQINMQIEKQGLKPGDRVTRIIFAEWPQ
jgi:hypothetical protein